MQSNKQSFLLTEEQKKALQSFSQHKLEELRTTNTDDNVHAEGIIEKLNEILDTSTVHFSKEILKKMLTDSGIEINKHIEYELNMLQNQRNHEILHILKELVNPYYENKDISQHIFNKQLKKYFPFLESSDVPLQNTTLILENFKKETPEIENHQYYILARQVIDFNWQRIMISEGLDKQLIHSQVLEARIDPDRFTRSEANGELIPFNSRGYVTYIELLQKANEEARQNKGFEI